MLSSSPLFFPFPRSTPVADEKLPFKSPDNFADHMVDEKIAISEYSLSASVACGKVRRFFRPAGPPIFVDVLTRAKIYSSAAPSKTCLMFSELLKESCFFLHRFASPPSLLRPLGLASSVCNKTSLFNQPLPSQSLPFVLLRPCSPIDNWLLTSSSCFIEPHTSLPPRKPPLSCSLIRTPRNTILPSTSLANRSFESTSESIDAPAGSERYREAKPGFQNSVFSKENEI